MMVKRCPNVIADELSIPRTQSLHSMNQSHISLQEPALNSLGMDQSKRIQRANSRPKLERERKLLAVTYDGRMLDEQ